MNNVILPYSLCMHALNKTGLQIEFVLNDKTVLYTVHYMGAYDFMFETDKTGLLIEFVHHKEIELYIRDVYGFMATSHQRYIP